MTFLWTLPVSFLIGSIPFAKIAMLGTGVDITRVGSGNPGFRNVARVASKWRAALTLIGDVAKGYVALLLLAHVAPSTPGVWLIAVAAVMGHCWSPFLGFNGGKGVATTIGVMLYLDPAVMVASLPLYVILRVLGRRAGWRQEGAIASLATLALTTALVLTVRGLVPGLLAALVLAIVVLRHASNLREIAASRGASPLSGARPGGI